MVSYSDIENKYLYKNKCQIILIGLCFKIVCIHSFIAFKILQPFWYFIQLSDFITR